MCLAFYFVAAHTHALGCCYCLIWGISYNGVLFMDGVAICGLSVGKVNS